MASRASLARLRWPSITNIRLGQLNLGPLTPFRISQHQSPTSPLPTTGTGWSRTVSSQIRKQLDAVVSPKSKLTRPIRKPKATWVEPQFYADIEYRDITSEGLLRASSFRGLSRR